MAYPNRAGVRHAFNQAQALGRPTGEVEGGGREGHGGNPPAPNLGAQVPEALIVEMQQTLRKSDHGVPEPLVITCCNRRGGCGKTTNATALAMSLAYRGFNVMYADMDPQTDGSQFLLSQQLDAVKEPFDAAYETIKREQINLNPQMSRAQAEEEAFKEAMVANPFGYGEVIGRKHISGNELGDKVRTMWKPWKISESSVGRPSRRKLSHLRFSLLTRTSMGAWC